MSKLFAVVESIGKGRIVVAAEDLLEGVEVILEEPLLQVVHEDLEDPEWAAFGDAHVLQTASAFYKAFKRLNLTNQEIYLSLYGPTDGPVAAILRHQTAAIPMSDQDRDEFIKVNMVGRFNAFKEKGLPVVYETCTRMSHSCRPNCFFYFTASDLQQSIHTSRPVTRGEELTICYDPSFLINPTHERREKYLRSKEFLCQCERCHNLGDDTRRFPCCTLKRGGRCKGWHCACQSSVDDKPYMLPCTMCQARPSSEWEADMFKLEQQELRRLPLTLCPTEGLLTAILYERNRRETGVTQLVKADAYLQSTAPLPLPMHYSAIYFLEVRMEYHGFLRHDYGLFFAHLEQLLLLYEYWLGCSAHHVRFLGRLSVFCVTMCKDNLLLAMPYLPLCIRTMQKSVRLTKKNRSEVNQNLKDIVDLMQQLQSCGRAHLVPSVSDNCCAQCEQSNHMAAVALKQCSRCKSVEYCGKACQIAHWKMHKTTSPSPRAITLMHPWPLAH